MAGDGAAAQKGVTAARRSRGCVFCVHTWSASALRSQGVARSIGVSNFTAAHLTKLFEACSVRPAVNQARSVARRPSAAQCTVPE